MSGGQGPGRRASYHSRSGGTTTPTGPRRPGRGGRGNNDNVLPLITGVLGSSILAFSLYVFSQKQGVFGADVDQPTVVEQEQAYYGSEQVYSCADPACSENSAAQPYPIYGEPQTPKINPEKRKWLTDEEAMERQQKDPNRSKLQRELKHHLRKVKELTEELERDEQAKKRHWTRDW